MYKVILVLVLFYAPYTVLGESGNELSGRALLSYCQADPSSRSGREDRIFCLGFLQGIIDGIRTFNGYTDSAPMFCMPIESSNEQARFAFVEYVKLNPSNLHLSAGSHVLLSLEEAFPCPKGD